MKETTRAAVDAYRNGEDEASLATLIELEDDIVPALAELFTTEADPDVRAFLVRVAWERREPTSVDFIVEALSDASEEVWQSALDGTVALASPEILEILHAAKIQDREDAAMARRFQMCVDEAILYVEGLVRAG